MARDPSPTWFFVVTVVHRQGKYLLVHERKHGQLWYLPAGRVEPGEDFIEAAKRETLEETGIAVELTGLVRIEHSVVPKGRRQRLIFVAEPVDDTPCKSEPDEHSLEAGWFALDDLASLALRGPDVAPLLAYLDRGGAVAPLSLLAHEGSSYR